MHSIRRRLTLVLGLGVAALIGGAGAWSASAVATEVTQEFDTGLLAKVRVLAALTEQEGGRIEFDYAPEHMPEFERAERPEYFQFWLDDGTVLMRSRHLAGDLPRAEAGPGPAVHDVVLPDGRPGRVARMAFVPRGPNDPHEPPGEEPEAAPQAGAGGRSVVLAVARGRERLDGLVQRTRTTAWGVAGAAALLALLLVWRALAAGLRPLEDLAEQVRALDVDRLRARVGAARMPRELAPIVEQVNALLDRLAGALERERRFTGNVAHELRTPIAELRSLAAVGARWPGDEEAVAKFFGDVDDVAAHMERVVDDLLLLARCQAGVETAEGAPVNLRASLHAVRARVGSEAERRGVGMRIEVPEDLVVTSDPGKLGIVLRNLLSNAASYARPETEVRCTGERTARGFRLEVANAAEPLTVDDLRNLTAPFWRKDTARPSGEHAGLGLALVAALTQLLHLDVRIGQDADGTFRVVLSGSVPASGRPAERAPVPLDPLLSRP